MILQLDHCTLSDFLVELCSAERETAFCMLILPQAHERRLSLLRTKKGSAFQPLCCYSSSTFGNHVPPDSVPQHHFASAPAATTIDHLLFTESVNFLTSIYS